MSTRDLIERAVEFAASDIADHHEYIINKEFNTKLDDGDLGEYAIYLDKPDGTNQQLEPTSKALFFSDRPTYRIMLNEYKDSRRNEILRLSEFPENELVYQRLKTTIQRGASVIPFVGAGFSVAAGCPSWSDYIISQATAARMKEDTIRDRLLAGEHEQVMDDVINQLTLAVFQRDFKSAFENGHISPALSPCVNFINLFDGSAITTNFDRVLDDCHSDLRKPFREKVVGKENTGRFIKAIYSGEKYLLKLHGNIDEPRDRVLTKQEYEAAYGVRDIDFDLPIPKKLWKIFSSFSILFCGCSLIADRYLQVLESVYEQERESMPDHFAILNAPDDGDEKILRDQFLARLGISPIWFSNGDWDAPSEILKLLKDDS